jgi:hypothetical protein
MGSVYCIAQSIYRSALSTSPRLPVECWVNQCQRVIKCNALRILCQID